MRLSYLFIVCLLCCAFYTVQAQEDFKPTEYSTYANFAEGDYRALIADNVNVRSQPSTKGDVVANLPIGTEVKILEVSDKTLKLSGFETYWYKTKFTYKGASKTGYVWGGFIAHDAIESNGVLFLYGLPSIKKHPEYDYYQIYQEVRAAKNSKELSRATVTMGGGLSTGHSMEVFGNRGVSGLKNIIEVGFSENMCGGAFGEAVVFWDGEALHSIRTLYDGADAPYWYDESFIYPEDEGGKSGKILFRAIEGEYSEEEGDIENIRESGEYVWTGNQLKER